MAGTKTRAFGTVLLLLGNPLAGFGQVGTQRPETPPLVAPFDGEAAEAAQREWARKLGVPREITNSIGMELMLIPPGEYIMGSPTGEFGRRAMSETQRRVRITTPFHMGRNEVRTSEYSHVMDDSPENRDAASRSGPATGMSWQDAVAFCDKLSGLPAERAAGRTYRLPTEAEWEYACRAGTETRFHMGDTLEGNFAKLPTLGRGLGGGRATRLAAYAANNFGLYDMHGNVLEWCSDWYQMVLPPLPSQDPIGPSTGQRRVARGGACVYADYDCRSASRFKYLPTHHGRELGFRVVMKVERLQDPDATAPSAN